MKQLILLMLAAFLSPYLSFAQAGFTLVDHGPSLITPRMDHMIATTPAGEVMLFGGHTTGFAIEGTAEYFDTTGQQWQSFPMLSTHDMGGMTILNNGTWLVFGGCSSDLGVGQLADAEIVDPITKTSSATGSMTIARTNCRGATLSSGKVLVVGNWYNSAAYADLYDPATGTFTATGNVVSPRSHAHVFPTNDGGAAVIGGANENGSTRYESIEYFDPGTNSFTTLQPTIIPDSSGYLTTSSGTYPPSALQLADGRYVFLATKWVNNDYFYQLVTFDPATKMTAVLRTTPALPTYNYAAGDTVAFSGEFIVDPDNNLIHLLGVSNDGTHNYMGLYTVDVNRGILQMPSALQPVDYHMGYSIPVLLHNGDIMLTGGSHNANFGAHDSVLTIRPTYTIPTNSPSVAATTLRLYPNPAQSSVTIEIPNQIQHLDGIVIDVLGRTMARYHADAGGSWQLSVANWPSGWYRVIMQEGNHRYMATFLKQ